MSVKKILKASVFTRPQNFQWDAPATAIGHWAELPIAATDDGNVISIYDAIGEDPWSGEGVTAAKIQAALKRIGNNPVTVKINSPGGDMFEGLAIYNLFAEHPAEVNVRVMGIAASAASLIAMAGDDVRMGLGTMMMIHCAWGFVLGNRHDFADAASVFEKFDQSMASIYAARTGMTDNKIMGMLDGPERSSDGTFMTADQAVELGFADGTFDKGDEKTDKASATLPGHVVAKRRLEAALAAQGVPRKERYALLQELQQGVRDAALQPGPRDAATPQLTPETADSIRQLIHSLKQR
jgi:ATP-dependent Clp protease, protease subunit